MTLSRTQVAIVAVVFGVVYAVSSVMRGNVVPGLVAGALGSVLVFLTITRVQEHAARRRREADDE